MEGCCSLEAEPWATMPSRPTSGTPNPTRAVVCAPQTGFGTTALCHQAGPPCAPPARGFEHVNAWA